jgi:hypothetical protein
MQAQALRDLCIVNARIVKGGTDAGAVDPAIVTVGHNLHLHNLLVIRPVIVHDRQQRNVVMRGGPGGTAAGNAFYLEVQRRVAASRESRKAVIEMAHVCERHKGQDYAEIVRQINICIAEIRPCLNMSELTQMLVTTRQCPGTCRKVNSAFCL